MVDWPKASDGLQLLADGKHLVSALLRLKELNPDMLTGDKPEFLNARLEDALTTGIQVNYVSFDGGDTSRNTRCIYYAMAHLTENNKMKETTLRSLDCGQSVMNCRGWKVCVVVSVCSIKSHAAVWMAKGSFASSSPRRSRS